MSSFVVGKEYYVKAAGLVAGIAEMKNVFVFDYKAGRRFDKDLFYNAFVEAYEMNDISVQEQYRDHEPEADPNDYKKEFNRAYIAGRNMAALDPEKLKATIMDLKTFFDCALYQTEKEPYYFKMESLFNRILAAFMVFLTARRDLDGWNFEAWKAI